MDGRMNENQSIASGNVITRNTKDNFPSKYLIHQVLKYYPQLLHVGRKLSKFLQKIHYFVTIKMRMGKSRILITYSLMLTSLSLPTFSALTAPASILARCLL